MHAVIAVFSEPVLMTVAPRIVGCALLFVAMTALSSLVQAQPAGTPQQATLYERLGGYDALAGFVDLAFPRVAAHPDAAFDLVIIPPWLGDMNAILQDEQDLMAWLRGCHTRGTYVTGVCTGTFLLAEAGLLAGREATTHWFWAPQFQARYPEVVLKPEKILIDGGDVICAGGMTAYLDLCLYLVYKFGSAERASMCSKLLLVDSGRCSQTPYQVYRFPKNHADEAVLKAQAWLEAHYQESVSVRSMARVAGLGKRTFMRRFRRATGDPPGTYVQRLRVQAARRMLESTEKTVSEITWEVGGCTTICTTYGREHPKPPP